MRFTRTDATARGRRRRPAPALAVIGLPLLLVACSSTTGVATLDGSEDGTTPTPEASVDPEQAIYDFAECMREHGIEMDDPVIVRRGDGAAGGGFATGPDEAPEGDVPPIDPNSEEFQEAEEECREHLEGFAAGPGDGPEMTEEQQQAFLDFAECMREHGIDMPDPQFGVGGGGVTIGPGEEGPAFDPRSEEFQEAEEACREHLDLEGFRSEIEEAAP
jgi:hypothetical protein